MADAIGQGFGPVIGGLLAASYNLDFAMLVSALFWIPYGIGFFILATTLPKGVEKVNQTMKEIRQEMVQKTDSVTV